MSYRDEARRDLESNAARKVQNEYLNEAKTRHEALRQFETVDDLLVLLRNRDADPDKNDKKDVALLALVVEHQQGSGGRAFALLAVAMFPKLDRIYNARRHVLDKREHDDLWGRIVDAFADALERYPVARRPARVAANIEGDTLAALRRAREREDRIGIAATNFAIEAVELQRELERTPDADVARQLSLGNLVQQGREAAAAPDPKEFAVAARKLDRFVAAGLIDKDDRALILGVHLYGRTLREVAAELGISRETAKKRHQRAKEKLREVHGADPLKD
ncbi:MAG: sigma-70 family RNA polymerase sigma factor [Myxococcales bacterium]|nr:sigma-70 family RNA polymerase sigma factor [Myxococcales bacterium]